VGTATCRRLRPTRVRNYYRTCSQRELLRALKRAGFYRARSRGPHEVFVHSEFGGSILVPKHQKDIANGTLAKILRAVKAITGEDLDV
jgi:predicted RNA binding protein YcfA (HicA-like mRNA interferase family)